MDQKCPYQILIVPGVTEDATQCRVYATEDDGAIRRSESALDAYRRDPDAWFEVGIMNSQGKLACFSGPSEVRQQLRDCEPLMGGLTMRVELDIPWMELARQEQQKAAERPRG